MVGVGFLGAGYMAQGMVRRLIASFRKSADARLGDANESRVTDALRRK
ncbi:MAG: hypothetical protein ACT4N4_12570 [Rhodospirillales bacterium]